MEKILMLKTGGCLTVTGKDVTFVDSKGVDHSLTEAEQSILAMLVQQGGQMVPYEDLYKGYSRQKSFGDINQMVADVKTHMCVELKACIRVVRGRGYRLDLSKFEDQSQNQIHPKKNHAAEQSSWDPVSHQWLTGLVGEYYGFYLDPLGDGTVLGAYLRIEECPGPGIRDIVVSGVLGIQSDRVLRNEGLADAFTGRREYYYPNYQAAKSGFSHNDKRCFFCAGKVTSHDRIAIIKVKTSHESAWNLLLDMEKYLTSKKYNQEKTTPYRGGMGMMITLAGVHGNYCCRTALIRREFLKPSISLNNPVIRDMLRIPSDLNWLPLHLDTQLDGEWYNWFMKVAE